MTSDNLSSKVREILSKYAEVAVPEASIWDAWGFKVRTRVVEAAKASLAMFPGDIIEIGAYQGVTTAELAAVAQKYKRRVMVVDPWIPGTQNCSGSEYETFLENTKRYKGLIDVVRLSSMDPEAVRQMRERPIAFAFVDGLHEYEPCLSDIQAVSHCLGAIAVDDISWNQGCLAAFEQSKHKLQLKDVGGSSYREGYLLPLDA